MKKSAFLKIAAAMVAVAMVAACGKDDGGKKDIDDDDDEVPITSEIKVDGSFSDWTALGNSVTTFETNANAPYEGDLKIVKIYAEEAFLNFYFEFSKDVLNSNDAGGSVLHIFIDVDGKQTGYVNEANCPDWFNYVIEGSVTDWDPGNPTLISYNPTCHKFYDDAETSWVAGVSMDAIGTDFTEGAGVVAGDLVKYEFQITREMLPMALPSSIKILFSVQQNWNASGILPIQADGTGYTYTWNIGSGS